jgi:hypothetical protein
MSAPDHGDDDKGFLARWSQRKQEAKQPDQAAPAPAADAGIAARPATETGAPEEFDLSSLPKLEDLTSTTDITGFLRKGVPEHLRNAALRKSWALDPAIRNYVNPALDYAYDWNTPGGVPGSSELGAGMDVARLVSQIMGTSETAVEPSIPAAENLTELASNPAPSGALPPELPDQSLRLSGKPVSTKQDPANLTKGAVVEAGQKGDSNRPDSAAPQHTVRRHGSAKPIT